MEQSNGDQVLKPNIISAMFGNLLGLGLLGAVLGVIAGYVASSVIVGLATLVIFTALTNVLGYFNLKATEYRFKPKQLEYREGFLNVRQSNVSFDRITDVSLRKPVTQRIFGTGSILVNTAGSDARELTIAYIDNPEEEFERVKQLIKD